MGIRRSYYYRCSTRNCDQLKLKSAYYSVVSKHISVVPSLCTIPTGSWGDLFIYRSQRPCQHTLILVILIQGSADCPDRGRCFSQFTKVDNISDVTKQMRLT